MKCLILIALVGFCTAAVIDLGRYKVLFNGENNAMIQGLTGNTYTFTNYPGQYYMDILINGIDTPMKKIRINGQTCQILNVEGFKNIVLNTPNVPIGLPIQGLNSQGILNLFTVFKNFQGTLSETQFEQLMDIIQLEVKQGKLCSIIYELLAYLDRIVSEELIQNYMYGDQIVQNQYPIGLNMVSGQNLGSLFWLDRILGNVRPMNQIYSGIYGPNMYNGYYGNQMMQPQLLNNYELGYGYPVGGYYYPQVVQGGVSPIMNYMLMMKMMMAKQNLGGLYNLYNQGYGYGMNYGQNMVYNY